MQSNRKQRISRTTGNPIARAVETLEPRVLMTLIAGWTFESTAPATAGPFYAESGSQTNGTSTSVTAASGFHASGSAVYSTPAGNGSTHSFSSNFWAVNDYYQFKTDSAGEASIQFQWDQTSSATGPGQFQVEYSLDGNTYTNVNSVYTVLVNAAGALPDGGTWSSSAANHVSDDTFTVTLPNDASNQSTVYVRLVDASTLPASGSGTVATGGTDRVDNVSFNGTDITVPTIQSLSVSPSSVVQGAGTPITMTANNVTDANAGATITGVNFYVNSISAANLLTGTTSASGNNYSISGISTASLPTGPTTYLAVATDSLTLTSASASTTLNVVGTQILSFDMPTYSVDESVTGGSETVYVDRTGTGTSSVAYSTSDGSHFTGSDPQVDGGAVAGIDYTATSGILNFSGGQTSMPITIPILDVKTFAGTRTFSLTLSNPTTATIGTNATTAVTITDDTVTSPVGVDMPTGNTTSSYNAIPAANGSGGSNGFAQLAYHGHNSYPTASAPEIEFGSGSSLFPATYVAGNIDSIKLSLFNTHTTGGFGGVPGSFDLYLLTDDTFPTSSLIYTTDQATGAAVLGSTPPLEGNATLVGTAAFTNNVVGYNDFTFDDLSTTVQNTIMSYFNEAGSSPIRFVIVPHTNSFMSADWEGNFGTNELPQLTLLVEESSQPAWLSSTSQASFDPNSHVLNVTGPSTIISNPGAAEPIITGTSAADLLTIAPTHADKVFDLGGIKLTGGASIAVSYGANPLLAVLAPGGLFSIDSTSKFDLGNNFLDLQQGNAAGLGAVVSDITSGLLSSSAITSPLNAIASTLDSSTGLSTVNGQSLAGNDVVVRYSYIGDANLDGQVDGSDYSKIDSGFMTGASGWSNGDFNYDNVINGSDYTLIDNAFNRQGLPISTPAAQLAGKFADGPAIAFTNYVTLSETTSTSDYLLKHRKLSASAGDLVVQPIVATI